MTSEIYTRQQFTKFLCLSILLLSGCTEPPDDILTPSAEIESVSTLNDVPIANLEERTFYRLQEAFPPPILDENFKTLQALANSDIYLAFLSRVSKQGKPFQTFDELLETTPPEAKKKIRPILKKHLVHLAINDQDIASFHKLATVHQGRTILIYLNIHQKRIPPHLKEAEADAVKNAPLFRWLPPQEIQPNIIQAFWKDFSKFVEDTTETAKKNTQKTLHEYGQDDGLIWLAIQEPRIFGIIFNTFRDPLTATDFLRWADPEKQEN
ncbi:MAG: hypothetical protein OXG97_10975 [Candidatus Poribacteria bacterium]|nr:hypothetical protein [Candidatus Poribacteria bacterium]